MEIPTTITGLLQRCQSCKTQEEATEFFVEYQAYCDTPEIARSNLGYIFGYLSHEEAIRMYGLFPVHHPVFGPAFGRDYFPTPEEAFQAGQDWVITEEVR